jgi:thiamine biosynthesis lipoprotein
MSSRPADLILKPLETRQASGSQAPPKRDIRFFAFCRAASAGARLSALFALALSLLLPFVACGSGRGEAHVETAEIMGSVFTVKIEGHDDPSAATGAAFDEIRRIDRLLSTYKEDSEISDVNRRAASEPVTVGAAFWEVALASRRYHELSDGCFDPTIRPLMKTWGFTRREGRVPTDEELAQALPLVDFGKVTLDEAARSIALGREGMALDFGGIAKGYAVDRAVKELKERGVNSAIIDAAGNFYALGTPNGRERWRAGVRHPLRRNEIIATLPVADRGVATSGNYERFFEIDGSKYCHIMDPRTGRPVEGMLSATVVAETAMAADALSTAVFVLGGEKGMALIESLSGVEAMLILQDTATPDGFRIILSTGLAEEIDLLLPASG